GGSRRAARGSLQGSPDPSGRAGPAGWGRADSCLSIRSVAKVWYAYRNATERSGNQFRSTLQMRLNPSLTAGALGAAASLALLLPGAASAQSPAVKVAPSKLGRILVDSH